MTEGLDFYSANGALTGIDVLDVDAMRLIYRLEVAGDAFYQGLADRIDNEEAAELLRRNGREELGHAERIRQAIALRLGSSATSPRATTSCPSASRCPTASPRFFPIIVQGELDGDAGYQRWADTEPDPAVARLLRQNGREETSTASGWNRSWRSWASARKGPSGARSRRDPVLRHRGEQGLLRHGARAPRRAADHGLRHGRRLRRPAQARLLDQRARSGEGFRESHICFEAADRATVRAFFDAAVGLGAEVLHEPRVWPEYHEHYYGAFVRDPDGNNVEACCHLPE